MGMGFQTLNNWSFPLPYNSGNCTIVRIQSSKCSQSQFLTQIETPDGVGQVLVTPGSSSTSSSCPTGYPCYFSSYTPFLVSGSPSPSDYFTYESFSPVAGTSYPCWYDASNMRHVQFCRFVDPRIKNDPNYQFYIGFGFGFGFAFGTLIMTISMCLRCCESRKPERNPRNVEGYSGTTGGRDSIQEISAPDYTHTTVNRTPSAFSSFSKSASNSEFG